MIMRIQIKYHKSSSIAEQKPAPQMRGCTLEDMNVSFLSRQKKRVPAIAAKVIPGIWGLQISRILKNRMYFPGRPDFMKDDMYSFVKSSFSGNPPGKNKNKNKK